jgi:hypothetical protein
MIPHDVERVLGGDPLLDGRQLPVRADAVEIARNDQIDLEPML